MPPNDQKEWTLQSEQTLKYRGTDIRKLNGRYKVSKHLNIEVPTHANYSQKYKYKLIKMSIADQWNFGAL